MELAAHIVMALLCLVLARPAGASAFLGQLPSSRARQMGPELEGALLAEIEVALGGARREATEMRLGHIEEALRPTFAALPKNEAGRLDHATVRYALHRLFVNRHGWFVLGLEPGGGAWSESSPATILQERLPSHVQELFERRLGGRGLDLSEVAIMAAMMQDLIHQEAVERLRHTYRLLNRSEHDLVSQEESYEVVDMYMVGYILGFNFSDVSSSEALNKRDRIEEAYPTWPETVTFLRAVQATSTPNLEEISFDNLAGVIAEVGEQYGRWQDAECRSLKNDLVKLEDRGTGRVRLADFYRAAANEGNWQFSESVEYLRQLGALDESDPRNLRVIIPNYISSPSNCVASSQYYAVCCLDECEELLSQLEESVGAPYATKAEIEGRITALPSATVLANRTLSAALMRKLDEVASHHSDRIPLHGRLLKQWMHLAYPRECPFPHVTGTTSPQRALDWMAASGQEVSATTEEMRQHMDMAPRRRPTAQSPVREEDMCGLWTMEEEVVSVHADATAAASRPSAWRSMRPALRGLALAAAVLSSSLAALRVCAAALAGEPLQAKKPQATRFCV